VDLLYRLIENKALRSKASQYLILVLKEFSTKRKQMCRKYVTVPANISLSVKMQGSLHS
jgi:hypothetical protein